MSILGGGLGVLGGLFCRPIALAMVRTKAAETGSAVVVEAEGRYAAALISPRRFWAAPGPD